MTKLYEAFKYNIPVFVDPKREDLRFYQGCTFIKPNLKEMDAFMRCLDSNYKNIDCVENLQRSLPTC